ncbi:MAG TPA: response regulator [Methylomirabilota bacterium]|jgi:CheY-like chemotaxis protein|nr:response regulator [Methylomirabilota bacterium]
MAKVLVVDDSVTIRKVVERALEARSIQVLSAASGTEAIDRIEREAPDVVICDVIMPDKDGYQICEFVKTHPDLAKTPVLLISGIVNGAVLERAAQVHSDDVMRKPFAAEELVRKIDGFLSAGAPRETRLGPAPATGREIDADAPSLASLSGLVTRPHDPVPDSSTPVPVDLKTSLTQFAALPGVVLAALVDREGFLIESAGELSADAELGWALASALAESADGVGRALTQGLLQALIVEYEGGVVVLNTVGSAAMLAIVLRDPTVLGKVRYSVKRALPELLRSM